MWLVQTVLVPRRFSERAAMAVVRRRGFHLFKVDEAPGYWRFRQREPVKGALYRTARTRDGVLIVEMGP